MKGLWNAYIGNDRQPVFTWVHTGDDDGSWYHVTKMIQIIGQRAIAMQATLTITFNPELVV